MDRVDARYKSFKEKVKKLGYMKGEAKRVASVMEKVSDFGMMSDDGNKKVARAVSKAKSEKELRVMLDKISKMAGGKYKEAEEDDVIQRAIWALGSTATGTQGWADSNILTQLAGIQDTGRDTEIRTDDMKKMKLKADDASKVYDILMKIKSTERSKYLRLLQKDIKSFAKTYNAILKVANR
jgi:hypothetical protein